MNGCFRGHAFIRVGTIMQGHTDCMVTASDVGLANCKPQTHCKRLSKQNTTARNILTNHAIQGQAERLKVLKWGSVPRLCPRCSDFGSFQLRLLCCHRSKLMKPKASCLCSCEGVF